jgi:uncharacterized protein
MIIDFHVHPRFQEPQQTSMQPHQDIKKLDIVAYPQQFGIAANQTAQLYYKRNPVLLSLPDFVKELDEAGIDRVVLLNAARKGIQVRPMNEDLAKILNKYPERFLGFAGFDPNNGAQAVQEIEYAIRELGLSGVKIVASMLELDIDDKAFYPCYAKAEELGVPILAHTGSAVIKGVRAKYVQPLMIDDVAFDFPDLKIICAHLGGWQYMDVLGMLVHHRNVYADISFWPLHPLYANMVPWNLLERTVSDKILLGSDYPAGQTPKEAVEAVRKLPVSQAFKEKILVENASKILRL